MNDLDVALASWEELQEYMSRKRARGKAACVRRIGRLRPDLKVITITYGNTGTVVYLVQKS